MPLERIDGPIVLDIPADPASLFLARCLTERLAERMEFPREEVEKIVLAVDEACSNVIKHAYGNRPGQRIVLTFRAAPARMEISIRDFGIAADPASFKSRDLSDIRPGGLGLHFIHNIMDEVRYEAPEDGGTILKLAKNRHPRESRLGAGK